MNALQALCDEPFLEATATVSTAEGLRWFLHRRPEVVRLRRALTSGELTPREVRAFVANLLSSLERRTKLSDEVALAAVAVAVESLPGDFALCYLSDLANVRIREMPLAPRVAALALARRMGLQTPRTLI